MNQQGYQNRRIFQQFSFFWKKYRFWALSFHPFFDLQGIPDTARRGSKWCRTQIPRPFTSDPELEIMPSHREKNKMTQTTERSGILNFFQMKNYEGYFIHKLYLELGSSSQSSLYLLLSAVLCSGFVYVHFIITYARYFVSFIGTLRRKCVPIRNPRYVMAKGISFWTKIC